MRVVIFLGAGFSAAFGLPVMRSFFHLVEDTSFVSEEDKEILKTLRNEAKNANSMLDSSPDNLEDVLTFAVMANRVGIYGSDVENRFLVSKRILWNIYRRILHEDKANEHVKIFDRFFGDTLTNGKHDISFVTTNYDIYFEWLLSIKGLEADSPNIRNRTNNGANGKSLYKKSGTRLCKLHGSVNWFISPDGVYADDGMASMLFEAGQNRGYVSVSETQANHYPLNDYPVIIPPSFLKADFVDPLPEMWRNASNLIRNAQAIIFIGYSFPSTDIEMSYFFARSLSDTSNIRDIYIVDPLADEIKEKIVNNKVAIKYGSHFKSYLRSVPNVWQDIKLAQILK